MVGWRLTAGSGLPLMSENSLAYPSRRKALLRSRAVAVLRNSPGGEILKRHILLYAFVILFAAVGSLSCVSERTKRFITTDAAPAAIGPYSQAVQVGDTLYLSGQIAIDPATGQLVLGGIEKETRQILDNIGAVLAEAGMDFSDVVQVQVFLRDIRHYSIVNEIYAEYFRSGFPARAALQVARLPKDVSVEIMATAVGGRR